MHALIMDDHEFVTTGLRTTLNEYFSDLEVSAANCSEDALRILTDHEVDIAVLDLFMPASGGASSLSNRSSSFPKVPIVVLSASESHVHIRKCLSYGVLGFVTKSSPREALFSAMNRALDGKSSVPEVTVLIDEVDEGANLEAIKEVLTPRQLDILECITRGRSNKQVARQLNLSENTVKVHVSNLLRGLGLSNRTEAAILGQKLRL